MKKKAIKRNLAKWRHIQKLINSTWDELFELTQGEEGFYDLEAAREADRAAQSIDNIIGVVEEFQGDLEKV